MFASVQLVADQLICSHLRSKATNHLSLRPRFEAHIPNTSAYLRAQDALIFMAHLFKPVALSASHSPSTNSPGRQLFALLVTPLPPIAMTKAWGEGFILFHLTYFFPPSLPSSLSSFPSSFLTQSHYIVNLTVLELAVQARLAWNSQNSICLCPPDAGRHHHAGLILILLSGEVQAGTAAETMEEPCFLTWRSLHSYHTISRLSPPPTMNWAFSCQSSIEKMPYSLVYSQSP